MNNLVYRHWGWTYIYPLLSYPLNVRCFTRKNTFNPLREHSHIGLILEMALRSDIFVIFFPFVN